MHFFSFTRLNTYLQCPYLYYLQYIYKYPYEYEESVFIIFGRMLHEAIEVQEYDNIFNKYFDKLSLSTIEKESWYNKGKQQYVLANSFRDNIYYVIKEDLKDSIRTSISEQKYTGLLTNNIQITGKIDLLLETGLYKTFIIDWKTGKNKMDSYANYSLQTDIYVWLYVKNNDIIHYPIQTNLVFLGESLPAKQTFMQIYKQEDIKKIEQKLLQLTSMILSEKAFVPKPSSLFCKYCIYKDVCRYSLYKSYVKT